jgi:hypothetical protein
MNIALWVLQILFAALFMLHAVLHLFPSPRLKGILAEQNIPAKRTIATWAEVVGSLGLILPGAVSIPRVDHDLPCLRPHLLSPAPLDDQFQGVTRGRRRRDKRQASRAKRGGGWYHVLTPFRS